ncbi:hypothetical protein SAMN05216571_103318 [Onishia taeanensis]|uniref:Uncharacterized protein n=1 Tax=Onishia taeanensis TaxID=284577 RepID=A0A1G7QKX7_9GAMM|nr:hypothetical protein SAMN05216571_103318 [Halomonas taeanensis]
MANNNFPLTIQVKARKYLTLKVNLQCRQIHTVAVSNNEAVLSYSAVITNANFAMTREVLSNFTITPHINKSRELGSL